MDPQAATPNSSFKVAIVGMSCRFPGASGPDQLWELLSEGRSAFRPLEERWRETLVRPRKHELTPPVARAGLLDSIRGFDAAFFGISPREATRMDPQQRILLELAWEAFEDAGIPPSYYAGQRVGVFVGFNTTDYWSVTMDSAHRASVDAWTGLGGSPCILSNRISYTFDLRGPSVSLDSACSASLVALHLARQSLASGESRAVLAGGVTLLVKPETTLGFARATMLSPTGESRPFSDHVNGYVRGEGAGLVLLKRLEDALEDGDTIHAVICGSAVSQDGRSNGITVPTVAGQAQMLELAYADAGIDPRSVRYVEAHGTGTPVGDPIETRALGEVVGKDRPADQACVIGSIKSNIGHLEAAAGIAGLIKAVLCLQHDRIVPSLASEPLSTSIPFAELGLRVATEAEPLTRNGEAPVVGVSSFGFGGTNAHVVLERAPDPVLAGSRTNGAQQTIADEPCLIPVSARSEAAARQQAANLAAALRRDPALSLDDVSHTLTVRRAAHAFRASVAGDTREGVIEQLESVGAGASPVREAATEPRGIAFVFTGMGPQWWGMGRELYRHEPVFRACVERVDRAFEALSGWSLRERVFEADEADVPSLVERADIGHPAHFALQMALCELLATWGIQPSAVVGHSAGEVSSACASGVLSFEDSVRVLYHRSRLVQELAGEGRMLAVDLSLAEAEQLAARHEDAVWVAAVNSPASVTLSGRTAILEGIAAELEAQGRFARLVPGCFPYHSPVFQPIRERLVASLQDLELHPPRVNVVSTVHGGWTQAKDFGSDYWWSNVRDRVRFADAIRTLLDAGHTTFVEIGAHPALVRALRETADDDGIELHAVETLRRRQEERTSLLATAGELWTLGHAVELAAAGGADGTLVRLPTYPWQHVSYWVEPEAEESTSEAEHPVRGDRIAADRPTWHARVSQTTPRWAEDHRINGEVLLPAVAWVEAWLSAAMDERRRLPVSLRDITFSELRPLSSQPVSLRIRRSGERWTLESAPTPDAAEWVHHGSALRNPHPTSAEPIDLDTTRAALHSATLDYDRYQDSGYQYMRSFRCVSEVWRGRDQVLVRLAPVPHELDDADYLLHPALFDGALHAILACIDRLDGLYLPVGFDEVTLHRQHEAKQDPELWAWTRLVNSDDGRMAVDVTVVNAHGLPILTARGAHLQRAGRPRYLPQRGLTQERWVPVRSLIEPSELRPRSCAPKLDALLAAVLDEGDPEPIHARLDALASAYVAEALTEIAGTEVNDLVAAASDGLATGRIAECHRQWVLKLASTATRSAQSSRELRRALTWHAPAWHIERQAVERFGSRLASLLRGEADPQELLLPPHTDLGRLLYADSASVRPVHYASREAVAAEIASLGLERTVRLLEIGAGTGGATAWILPALNPNRTEYVFTDLSPAFFGTATQRWPGRLTTAQLDIGKDPAEQGFELNSFDIVLAWTVLHATPDLSDTLRGCLRLLRPNGLLLLTEPIRAQYWMELVVGGFEGWWKFTDRELRPDHPLLGAARWEALLLEQGFAEVRCQNAPHRGPFEVLAARAPDENAPVPAVELPSGERWLIVGSDPLVPILKQQLEEGGRTCNIVRRSDERVSGRMDFDRIVYFARETADEFQHGAHELLTLVQRVDPHTPQLTIVTRGAQIVPGEDRARNLGQAATWGFARVVANEHPDLDVRLIDLGFRCDTSDARALLAELALPAQYESPENEVALRGAARFVPRVTQVLPESLEDSSPECTAGSWFVRCDRKGDLDSLSIRQRERRAPKPHEIEIAVEASALSFHDVLLALGMIQEDHDKVGCIPQLGSDCVGTVMRTGRDVVGVTPGDRVVGFAHGALTSHLCAPACLFVPVPGGMSSAEAVTLPTVTTTLEMAFENAAQLKPGETVLVHSGAGGVGLTAIQWALQRGARVLATAGTAERRDWLNALGVEVAGDSHNLSWFDHVLELTGGRGVDVVLNSLRGEAIDKGVELLAPLGRFIELGKRDVAGDHALGLRALARQSSVHIIDLSWLTASRPEIAGHFLRAAFERVEAGTLGPLPYIQIPIERVDEAYRLMASGRHTGKIIVTTQGAVIRPRSLQQPPVAVRDDATYLVTGGLGGLGMATARWLSQRGARYLALVGRRGAATDESKQVVADLRREGVQVTVFHADVCSEGDVTRVLREIKASLPPLRGIFHAAMILEDSIVSRTSHASLDRVFDAKALGAWRLHKLSGDADLDFFVMCSSVSRVLATPGQACYVSANEFLAALTSHRRSLRKPATCIDWSVIEDVGYVSRNQDVFDRMIGAGFGSMPAADALDAMGHVMTSGVQTIGIFDFDWRHLERLFGGKPKQRYAGLQQESAEEAPDRASTSAAVETIQRSSSAVEREGATIELVRARAAGILRRSGEAIGADTPLVDLGFDSLMEVELRASLQRDTGLEMSTLRSMRGGTVRSVARLVLDRLGYGDPSAVENAPEVSDRFVRWVNERARVLTQAFDRADADTIRSELQATLRGLDGHVDHLDAAEHALHRAIFYPRLARFFLESALLRRGHDKPFGYAGDYEVMKMVYRNHPAGEGAAAAADAFALDIPISRAVRYRPEFFLKLVQQAAASRASVRAASIGCGPAWEARILRAEHPELARRLQLVLVDQDEGALADCRKALTLEVEESRSIDYLCATVESLTDSHSAVAGKIGSCDLVWSSGLFDYFNDPSFGIYLQALYDFTAPSGILSVGNVSEENSNRWLMEYVTDWFLHHRSPEDLLCHAQALDPMPGAISVEKDPSGVHLFLVIERPEKG